MASGEKKQPRQSKTEKASARVRKQEKDTQSGLNQVGLVKHLVFLLKLLLTVTFSITVREKCRQGMLFGGSEEQI